jgi:mono/diheme cytochrome c family protein
MPVLLLLPLWAVVYMGAFGERGGAELSPLELGAQVYQTAGCGACHGPAGQGVGAFPALAGGEAALTFPDEADHIAWVEEGSQGKQGQPYGDPNRPGGQRVATSGGMPPFAGLLTPEEIAAVVLFEREGL